MKKTMPPAQAVSYAIEGARNSYKWLLELQAEWEEKLKNREDGSSTRKHQRIVADAFMVYLNSLFQTSTRYKIHSLIQSYKPHPFVEAFKKHKLVILCSDHRNNRSAHQSQFYGFVVPLEEILTSDIDSWLSDAYYLVCTNRLPLK